MKDFKGKNALVTGAASGMGKALALALADAGANLFLADINEPGLEQALNEARSKGVKAAGLAVDMSDEKQVSELCARALAELGSVDILANIAGFGMSRDIAKTSVDDWKNVVEVNLYGPFYTINNLLGHMLERGSGHIINLASAAGLVAVPSMGAYNAAKFGLVGLSETLRAEAAVKGVGVTVVCPGPVRTRFFDRLEYPNPGAQKVVELIAKWFGWTPERVAYSILKAVRKNKPVLTLSFMTWSSYAAKRLCPSLVYALQRIIAERSVAERP